MSALGDDLRKRSAEQQGAAAELLDSPEFGTSPKLQSLFVVGQTTANILEALADVADYQQADSVRSKLDERTQALLERNNAIRTAAAAGFASNDWSRFDGLLEQYFQSATGEGSTGGNGG